MIRFRGRDVITKNVSSQNPILYKFKTVINVVHKNLVEPRFFDFPDSRITSLIFDSKVIDVLKKWEEISRDQWPHLRFED